MSFTYAPLFHKMHADRISKGRLPSLKLVSYVPKI